MTRAALLLTLAGTALAAGALAAARPPEQLQARAAAGDRTRFRFAQELRLELREQRDALIVDGEESESSAGPAAEFVVEEREQVVFVDEVLAAEQGEARELVRRFETLASRSIQTVETADKRRRVRDGEGKSPLEGLAVRFRPAEAGAGLRAEFVEPPEELGPRERRELLAGLEARCDLSWFLPPAAVEVDESWTLPASALRRLSFPSGELGLRIEGDERGSEFGAAFHRNLRGELVATYLGRRDVRGAGRAVVRLQTELTTSFTIPRGEGVFMHYAFEFELDGELVWDPAAGRALSLDWRGPVQADTETLRPGREFSLLTRQRFEGTLAFTAAVEPAAER